MDILIPIVFPDYRITLEIKSINIDTFPWVPHVDFMAPVLKEKVSNLGHAGVLFINGRTAETKYYEYGRYDRPLERGVVVKAKNLPDAKIVDGKVDPASLKVPLEKISRISGQSGRIEGVFIEVDGKYDLMLAHAEMRRAQNAVPQRRPYDLVSNSCIHFVKEVTQQAGVSTPWMVDPRPNSYIGEFRDDYPDLDFHNGSLIIEGIGRF